MSHPFRKIPHDLWDPIFTRCPIPMMILSTELKVLEVNSSFLTLTNRVSHDLVGQPIQSFTRPEDVDKDVSLAYQVLHGSISGYSLIKAFLSSSGELVWVKSGLQGVCQNGSVVCLLVSAIQVRDSSSPQGIPRGGTPSNSSLPEIKEWAKKNLFTILSWVLGAIAASYVFYADWKGMQKDSEKTQDRLDRIEEVLKSFPSPSKPPP